MGGNKQQSIWVYLVLFSAVVALLMVALHLLEDRSIGAYKYLPAKKREKRKQDKAGLKKKHA